MADVDASATLLALNRLRDRHGNSAEFLAFLKLLREKGDTLFDYHTQPVSMAEFIDGKQYLNLEGIIYPEVRRELIAMSSGDYVEVIAVGSIGSAKTSIAVWGTAYQLYLLSCMRHPHKTYGIAPTDEILIICQNINSSVAKKLDYARLKKVIDRAPYFKEKFPYNPNIESELQFPNNIIVRPIGSSELGAIGENVIGGIIDELNFMEVVEKSKRSIDGGEYDQATSSYNAISKRRKSRFMTQGKTAGILFLVSSRRYPGQFTDIKEAQRLDEIKRYGKSTTYLYDKRIWDIKPDGSFSEETFQVFTGDSYHTPFIVTDDRKPLPDYEHLVIDVPVDFYDDFANDLMGALRDIAGVATIALHPYITNSEKVKACFHDDTDSIFSNHTTDFVHQKIQALETWDNPEVPRYVHIDLAVSGDSAGFAIGHVSDFIEIDRGDHMEKLPNIVFDGTLEIKAPPGGEIDFSRVRRILYALTDMGLNIKWVSFDQFQSKDGMQILQRKGYSVGYLSTERSITPYATLKNAFLDGRVTCKTHPKLITEILSLEYDAKKCKVDHPPNGSNDIADAVCGVIYGLSTRAEIYALHGVTPSATPGDSTQFKNTEEEHG